MQADLRLCWSHIQHCWKSHALSQFTSVRTLSEALAIIVGLRNLRFCDPNYRTNAQQCPVLTDSTKGFISQEKCSCLVMVLHNRTFIQSLSLRFIFDKWWAFFNMHLYHKERTNVGKQMKISHTCTYSF